MRIIAKPRLRDFWQAHPDAEQPLNAWWRLTLRATWRNPTEAKLDVATVSVLKKGRLVFNVGGGKYRLVVAVRYQAKASRGKVWIRWIGTHSDYDDIDANTV